jgi:hypothetical protein
MSTTQNQFGPALRLQLPDLSIRAAGEPRAHEISVFVTHHRPLTDGLVPTGSRSTTPLSFDLVAVSRAHKDAANHVMRQREELRPGETKRVTITFGNPPRSASKGEQWFFVAIEGRADRPEASYANNSIYIHYFLMK